MHRAARAADARPADWVVAALTDFAVSVHSVVPRGFDAYVRVFHPAYLDGAAVPWRAIAAATGRVAHPGMQLCALMGGLWFEQVAPDAGEPYDTPPAEGHLPAEVAGPLVAILERHTATASACWFGVWEGWGAAGVEVRAAPAFAVPHRTYHLHAGPIEAALDSFCRPPFTRSASLWWPDDRAWCVATEVDFKTTYVGCSEACRDDLVGSQELEAYAIDPSTGIVWASDTVNPRPAGSP